MKTIRDFEPADRYVYDFGVCSIKNGFAQIDTGQDASYFGMWCSPDRLMIVSYIEGDVVIQTADNLNEFIEEINNIKTWNNANGYGFYGIDPGLNEDFINKFHKIGLGELLH